MVDRTAAIETKSAPHETGSDDGTLVNAARAIESGIEKAKAGASELSKKSMSDCVDDCTSFVKDNPGKSLLLAAGAGAALALLLRRR